MYRWVNQVESANSSDWLKSGVRRDGVPGCCFPNKSLTGMTPNHLQETTSSSVCQDFAHRRKSNVHWCIRQDQARSDKQIGTSCVE
jgi:hypothetical protein